MSTRKTFAAFIYFIRMSSAMQVLGIFLIKNFVPPCRFSFISWPTPKLVLEKYVFNHYIYNMHNARTCVLELLDHYQNQHEVIKIQPFLQLFLKVSKMIFLL